MKYKVKAKKYLSDLVILNELPNGNILCQGRGARNLYLYTLDKEGNLELLSTWSTGVLKGMTLPSGKILLYAGNRNIYRSNDLNYNSFSIVHTTRTSIIDRAWDMSPNGTIMYVEYATSGTVPPGDRPSPPEAKVWKSTNDGLTWQEVFTIPRNAQFEGDTDFIRHFHTIAYDKYSGKWYFSSGDGYSVDGIMANGFEVKFWELTDGATPIINLIHEGQQVDNAEDQMWRAVSYVFTPEYIIWGTDSPDVQSYYIRYNRQTGTIEKRTPVSGSIFITDEMNTKWGKFFIGNAAVEGTAAGIWDDYTRLYLCVDREGKDWHEVYKWKKNPNHVAFARLAEVICKDETIFVRLQNVLDEDGNAYVYEHSAILEITKDSSFYINDNGVIKSIDVYISENGEIKTSDVLVGDCSTIKA